jgi:hypothetical protein
MQGKNAVLVFLLVLVVVSTNRHLVLAVAKPSTPSTPPTPTLVDVNPSGSEGDYWIGAIPPNFNPDKPVLVFVPGLGRGATSWWGSTNYYGSNDMYQYAYNAGYRTAFVSFRDADGNPGDMWRNGLVLKQQLESICRYFHVAQVDLICHSKGGIDAQAAIVHYGAFPYVAKVFTLSTPHWGSQLADLAYTSWASWLGALLNMQNDGIYSLQTAYMSYFRSNTDARAENGGIAYFTSAGTDWGPKLSGLYFGGLYLSEFGCNDGSVTVDSAHNPRAIHISTSRLNHDNIRMGRNSWQYIEPKICSYQFLQRVLNLRGNRINNKRSAIVNIYAQGGTLQPAAAIDIPVDSLSRRINIDFMVADPRVIIQVIAPKGTGYYPTAVYTDTGFFNGATHYLLSLANPEKGYWQVRVTSLRNNAYFLIVRYDSLLKLKVNTNQQRARAGLAFDFKVDVVIGKRRIKTRNITLDGQLDRIEGERIIQQATNLSFTQKDSGFQHELALPAEPGLYKVSANVKGTLDDGTPFARSLVYSVMVESEQYEGLGLLQSLASSSRRKR